MTKLLRKCILLCCCSLAGCWLSSAAAVAVPRVNAGVEQQADSLKVSFRLLLLDDNEEPIRGALVVNTRTSQNVLTDEGGTANLVVADPGDRLEISLSGTIVKEYTVTAEQPLPVIVLSSKHPAVQKQKSVQLLNKLAVPQHLTAASTQAVYNNDITRMPVTGIRNTLTGRIAGLYSNQGSGQPGSDGVSLFLHGQNPLVLIDGVPRTLTIFDLEEIESITLLKDALSTAMMGVRGSPGILSITTRQGTPSKQRISFTAQTAFQEPVKTPQPLNAYNYALLYNEALQNDGLAPVYTDADLAAYRDHTDPYGHPDIDWRKKVLKNSSQFNRYTLSTSGGNEFARYFVTLEHFNQNGALNQSDTNTYSTNNYLKSYTIRSNVDINITPKVSAGLHLLGRILNGNEPGTTTGTLYSALLTTPNNAYPVFNPNGTFGGTQQFQNNIWAQIINSGYRQNYKRDMLADVYLKRTLDEVTPGLWIKAQASYYATLSETIYRTKTFAVFKRNVGLGGEETYQQFGTNGTQGNSNGIDYQGRADYLAVTLGYNRKFNIHGIDGMLFFNRDNSVDAGNLPYTIRGVSGRFSYNYDEKYVAEVAFGLNGSNYYGKTGSYNYGFFPAAGLAWNISKEDFLKDVSWLNSLKLFTSFGRTGWDNPGYFEVIRRYFDGAGAYFGTGATWNTSMNEVQVGNSNMSFEQANKFNIGAQGYFLDNRLSFVAEYYNNKHFDLLMIRGKNNAIFGNTYPRENIGEYRYKGVDLQLNWAQDINKDLSYFAGVTAGTMKSEVLFIDEVNHPYPWMLATGKQVGQTFGYIADGFFQTQTETETSATIDGYTPQLGDIKYKDLNGDNVINQFDQAPIGSEKPLITYGVNVGFTWKFIDVSALLQGVANRKLYLSGDSEWEFQNSGYGQAYKHHLDRWTPDNTDASYPRLGIGKNINNQATSSFWMKDGNYARLRFVEIGFKLPETLIKRVGLRSTRFFVNATNLLTFYSLDRVDPEVGSGAYPMQRLINLGVNIKM